MKTAAFLALPLEHGQQPAFAVVQLDRALVFFEDSNGLVVLGDGATDLTQQDAGLDRVAVVLLLLPGLQLIQQFRLLLEIKAVDVRYIVEQCAADLVLAGLGSMDDP